MWAPAELVIFALVAFALGAAALLFLVVAIWRGSARRKRDPDP